MRSWLGRSLEKLHVSTLTNAHQQAVIIQNGFAAAKIQLFLSWGSNLATQCYNPADCCPAWGQHAPEWLSPGASLPNLVVFRLKAFIVGRIYTELVVRGPYLYTWQPSGLRPLPLYERIAHLTTLPAGDVLRISSRCWIRPGKKISKGRIVYQLVFLLLYWCPIAMFIFLFFSLERIRLILGRSVSYLLGVEGIGGLTLIPVILFKKLNNLIQIFNIKHRLQIHNSHAHGIIWWLFWSPRRIQ